MQRCHYEVLAIPNDADEGLIRKSYRKLALQHHPDKGGSAEDFRLIQEAYETLSDPVERRWYDDNRESILKNNGEGKSAADAFSVANIFLFDVTSFHIASCYRGYGDDVGGFYHTYSHVFQEIIIGEQKGWLHEGNIDDNLFPLHHLPSNFGTSTSDYSLVSALYSAWEQFSSCLSYAWVDPYDSQLAESRWERRRIEEENNKARRIAKKKRNDDIAALVAFIKKRDPRVLAARERAQAQKLDQDNRKKAEIERRKLETIAAKEAWAEENERVMKQYEMDDLNAGRIRLADLDDSDDDERRGGKSKKKKKGRDRKKKNSPLLDSDITNECEQKDAPVPLDEHPSHGEIVEPIDNSLDAADQTSEACTKPLEDSETDEDDFDLWRCEVCRKDFKSKKQLENHVQSKKHKEAVKKMDARIREQESD